MTMVERIKKLGAAKSLNIKRIEESVGLGNGTIRRWNESPPSADKLLKIANLLDTTCEYLLTGKESLSFQISPEDIEWISLIHQLPLEDQYEFRGEIKGYLKALKKKSATTDEPQKTGTDSPK